MALYIKTGNVNAQTTTILGYTALHIAAKFGQEEGIRQLLAAGSLVDARDTNNQTPLSLCACYNNEPIIPQLLVNKGADVNAADNYSWKPVFWACFRDFDRTYDVLRSKGARLDTRDNKAKTPLHWAAQCGSVRVMRKMLDADRFLDLQVRDVDGFTPILCAAWAGQVESLKLLIAHDAHKNVRDNIDWTPLFWAAYKGHTEAVKYLLGRRVGKDFKDRKGKSAYDWADSPQVKALLSA